MEVNGKADLAHESFVMREHYKDNIGTNKYAYKPNGFSFCKTAQKPYDTVVVSCLAIIKNRLKNLIEISSDGNSKDWELGVAFASKVLKKDILNPLDKNYNLIVNTKSGKLLYR